MGSPSERLNGVHTVVRREASCVFSHAQRTGDTVCLHGTGALYNMKRSEASGIFSGEALAPNIAAPAALPRMKRSPNPW